MPRLKKTAMLMTALGAAVLITASPNAHAQKDAVTDLFNNANKYLQNGQNDQAIDAFKNLLDAAKDNPAAKQTLAPVYYGLGAAYFNSKRYQEAVDSLMEIVKNYKNSELIPEVQFFLAQSYFLLGDFQKSLDGFRLTEKNPTYRDESLLFQAQALRKLNKASDAVEPLEKLIGTDIRSGNAARGAIDLAIVYTEKGEAAKAVALLEKLSLRLRMLPNVAAFNQAVAIIGDSLLNNKKEEESLAVFRLMRRKDDVIALQNKQIEQLMRLIKQKQDLAKRSDRTQAPRILGEAARYETMLADIRKSQEDFNKAPDNTPGILLRTAKAYYDLGRKWEAITVYEELLMRFPQGENKENALFALIATYPEVEEYKRAQDLVDVFVQEFPKSERAEEVMFLKGMTALQNEDPEAAVKTFADLLVKYPETKYKEDVAVMIANSKFGMGLYDEARADYEAFLKTYPQSTSASEVHYRMPLCLVFSGQYEKAIGELNAFIQANSDSPYVPDANYRLMVCYFAAAVNDKTGDSYNKIIKLTEDFEKQYPDHPSLADVLALRGDAYVGLTDTPGKESHDSEAASAYLKGSKLAKDEESLNYNLFEAVKLWQKHGEWEKINVALGDFIKDNPDHPSASMAKYWVGRSLLKQKKDAEAKQFYAKEIKENMSQPRKDAVEMMIRELVQMLSKKRKVQAATAVSADGSPAAPGTEAAPPPPPPPQDPEAELDSLIGGDETMKNRTSTARYFLAKALLAQFRGDSKLRDTYYDQLADFEPSELSAYLLGQMADYNISKATAAHEAGDVEAMGKSLDKAERFCKELLASYPKSEFIEFAYVGQGDIAAARGNWKVSNQWYKEAVEVAGAQIKLKEATFGQGRALLELQQYPEAKAKFEEVASTRAWRGPLTAESIYWLGVLEARQGHMKEAVQLWQRVYASYARYTEATGKAYIESAKALRDMSKQPEATSTLGELLRNDKMPQKYRDEARKLQREWGVN